MRYTITIELSERPHRDGKAKDVTSRMIATALEGNVYRAAPALWERLGLKLDRVTVEERK